MQLEEHKQLLAQQNTVREQSETHWLKLIDQAKQETKEERKKFENFCHQHNGQIKKLELQLAASQKSIHENSAHLKTS